MPARLNLEKWHLDDGETGPAELERDLRVHAGRSCLARQPRSFSLSESETDEQTDRVQRKKQKGKVIRETRLKTAPVTY
jgi:hypothetical protein